MKVAATQAALKLKAGGEPLQAVVNWTVRRGRYRAPTPEEARRPEITGNTVVRDEGLIFVRTSDQITIYALSDLGL